MTPHRPHPGRARWDGWAGHGWGAAVALLAVALGWWVTAGISPVAGAYVAGLAIAGTAAWTHHHRTTRPPATRPRTTDTGTGTGTGHASATTAGRRVSAAGARWLRVPATADALITRWATTPAPKEEPR